MYHTIDEFAEDVHNMEESPKRTIDLGLIYASWLMQFLIYLKRNLPKSSTKSNKKVRAPQLLYTFRLVSLTPYDRSACDTQMKEATKMEIHDQSMVEEAITELRDAMQGVREEIKS